MGIKWYYNRLKKMSIDEVFWRLGLKWRSSVERRTIMGKSVAEDLHYRQPYLAAMPWTLHLSKETMKLGTSDKLFGYIDTQNHSSHDAFYNGEVWPQIPSTDIKYKNVEGMGDARITWEYSRHNNLQVLAKNFVITGELKYLVMLHQQYENWVKENPFMIGINYVSEMELAIRALSWYLAYEMLPSIEATNYTRERLKNGFMNLLCHVEDHHSRFSSANNHLIVEMAVLGIVGGTFGIEEWIRKSLKVLPYEMKRQNYKDGVNKEQSIHYQLFVMEAVALWVCRMKDLNIVYDKSMESILEKMSDHVADLMDSKYHIPHLGDDDGGKLFDLYGTSYNHYVYVLQLTGYLLGKHYVDAKETGIYEQVYALFGKERCESFFYAKERIIRKAVSTIYESGGHTILRGGKDKEVIVTFDHAPLGFGTIAAHGHADALHVTLRINGIPFLIDPGTYLYHGDIQWRNYFRRTINHNTVTINDKDQSEMQGAFLWGHRAKITKQDYNFDNMVDYVCAAHDGYEGIIHERAVTYSKPSNIEIDDVIAVNEVVSTYGYCLSYIFDSKCHIDMVAKNQARITNCGESMTIEVTTGELIMEPVVMSTVFGDKVNTNALRVRGKATSGITLSTKLMIEP